MYSRFAGILLAWLLLMPPVFGMKVGTYNIRYDNPGDARDGNPWSRRAPVIASLIRFHDFEVIGTQEGLWNQMQDLQRLMPEYGCVSHGRDDGKLAGEHAGIFYRKDCFDLMDSGMFWLSQTPTVPGKGWDAQLPRICVWAKLRKRTSGKSFWFLTVHLDHRGEIARRESINLIMGKAAGIAGDGPVVLTGDFNGDQHSDAYQQVAGSGRFRDAAEVAEIAYLLNGTANGFNPGRMTESRIDHVFVPTGTRVLRYGILTDSYRIPGARHDSAGVASANFPSDVKFKDYEARLPSDHFPVLVEIAEP